MIRSMALAGIVVLGGVPVLRSEAANPVVSVELKQVTAAEAVEALGKASGLRLQLNVDPPYTPAPPDFSTTRLAERKDFHWTRTRLATALRELCTAYTLACGPTPEGFVFRPLLTGAPARPAVPVGLVRQEGAWLAVHEIRVAAGREVRFDGAPASPSQGSATLTLQCVLPEDDGHRIMTIENLSARDDRGRFLIPARPGARRMPLRQFPDEWFGQVTLEGLHPQASRLAWIEGDVIAYRKSQSVRLDLPLPQPNSPSRKTVADLAAEVVRVDLPPLSAPAPDARPAPGARPRSATPTVTVRVLVPQHVQVHSLDDDSIDPLLVGRSGKVYYPSSAHFQHEREGDTRLISVEASGYFGIAEPIEAVRLDLLQQAEPARLLTFRMRDVPLPSQAAGALRLAGWPKPVSALPPDHPFYDREGGTIVTRVEFPPGPIPQGVVSLGLSRAEPAADTGSTWVEVELDRAGFARLNQVKPGRYRLLRALKGKPGQPALTDGWWSKGEIYVQVQPGREASGESLRWIRSDPREGTPAPPAAARRKRGAAPTPAGRSVPGAGRQR